ETGLHCGAAFSAGGVAASATAPAGRTSFRTHAKMLSVPPKEARTHKGGIMRTVIAALFVASTLAAGAANAQYAPFNEVGVAMGHWHLASRDAEANKKIFVGMGGQPVAGNAQSLLFPGMRINLTLGNTPGNGGSQGSVVN